MLTFLRSGNTYRGSTIVLDSATITLTEDSDGRLVLGSVGGAGSLSPSAPTTTNNLTRWASGSTITDAGITDNGTTINVVSGRTFTINGTAPSLVGHTHAIADVTGLQTALDAKQALDADLTAIAALAGTSGLLRKTAADTWSLDTAAYLTGNQTITLSGGATGSGSTAITVTLSNTAVTGQALTGYAVGSNTAIASTDTILQAFQKAQGQINARLTGNQTITLSGGATGSGTTAITVTLTNSAVTGQALTGYTLGTVGAVSATDTILAAFGKVQASLNDKPSVSTPYNDPSWINTLAGSKISGAVPSATSAVTATQVSSAVTFQAGGGGASGGITFNGSAAVNVSYNTVGAAPLSHTHDWASITSKPSAFTPDWVHSGRDFADGTLIETNIPYNVTNGDAWVLEIRGNSYGTIVPFDIQVQGYIYTDTIIHVGGISNGSPITGIVAINYSNNLCFWFPRQAYWHGYYVRVYVPYATFQGNRVTSITNSVKPTTAKEVNISSAIRQSAWGDGSYASGNWNIRAYPRRQDGVAMDVYWSGQGGQPTYVLGSNDGTNWYVWNPSNFSVASAAAASTPQALTIQAGGGGASGGITFNGSTAVNISYNTVGAPSTTGTNASGSWNIFAQQNAGIAYTGWPGHPGTAANGFYGGNSVRSTFTYANEAPHTGSLVLFPTGGYDLQFNASYGGAALSYRSRNGDNGTWNSWARVLDEYNVGSYALPISGGTLTGGLTTPGSVWVGVGGNGQVQLSAGTTSYSGYVSFNRPNGTRAGYIGFTNDGAGSDAGTIPYVAGSHAFTGAMTVTSTVTASDFTSTSDIRLKQGLERLVGALSVVTSLNGYKYSLRDSGKDEYGLVYQEVKEVAPYATALSATGYGAVMYQRIIPWLVEAIKELDQKINEVYRWQR